MISKLPSRRPNHGTVVGYLALFVALGGTSYGVATGSIDSREIKDGSLRAKDVRNNELGSTDVRNGSLLARDFKAGQLPSGARGAQGPQGVPGRDGQDGQDGLPGEDGEPGATNVVIRTAASPSGFTQGLGVEKVANCQGAERATGGGYQIFNYPLEDAVFVHSTPEPNPNPAAGGAEGTVPTGWSGRLLATTTDANAFMRTYVICAAP